MNLVSSIKSYYEDESASLNLSDKFQKVDESLLKDVSVVKDSSVYAFREIDPSTIEEMVRGYLYVHNKKQNETCLDTFDYNNDHSDILIPFDFCFITHLDVTISKSFKSYKDFVNWYDSCSGINGCVARTSYKTIESSDIVSIVKYGISKMEHTLYSN